MRLQLCATAGQYVRKNSTLRNAWIVVIMCLFFVYCDRKRKLPPHPPAACD